MGIEHHHPGDPRTVTALVDARATDRGDATWLVATETGCTLGFAALQASCRRVGALLDRLGVAAGENVAIVMPNGIATVRLLLGAMYSGRVVVPVNLLSQPEQMRYVIGHAGCRLIFASPDWTARLRQILAGSQPLPVIIEVDPDATVISGEETPVATGGIPEASLSGTPQPAPSPEDLALLMYTSGTTGKPKGVMLTHANLAANAHAISREHQLGPADRVAAVLPLYHINAFAVTMLAPLAHGGSLAIAPRFSTGRFWPTVLAHRCTWINVVPTIISYLLEGESPPREQLAAIRFCRSASAALPPEHHRAFEAKFGIGIIETMGLTETVAPAFSNPIEARARRIGSVGRPSGCEARIVDAAGQTLPDGETGEILIRGPQVTRGYFHNPEATRSAFLDDWLRTGDLGTRDADGYFHVTGRIKELIIKGGENIAPREIDEVLLRHPAVADAAAVGLPDRHYGQEILACVIVREERRARTPQDEQSLREELRAFCATHLGQYKTPREIRFVDELPRGPSGKVQRLKLVDAG
ncbi:MAG: AMP-binding protein [Burkholderiaceae bacterium]|nr:AMP-binding protein [Burkholderiaceae bacterium]MEB2351239.1 AMP-binding protein [Burkholderiaceae bacterium]